MKAKQFNEVEATSFYSPIEAQEYKVQIKI